MKKSVITLFVLSLLAAGCNQQQQLSQEKQAWCEAQPQETLVARDV